MTKKDDSDKSLHDEILEALELEHSEHEKTSEDVQEYLARQKKIDRVKADKEKLLGGVKKGETAPKKRTWF